MQHKRLDLHLVMTQVHVERRACNGWREDNGTIVGPPLLWVVVLNRESRREEMASLHEVEERKPVQGIFGLSNVNIRKLTMATERGVLAVSQDPSTLGPYSRTQDGEWQTSPGYCHADTVEEFQPV